MVIETYRLGILAVIILAAVITMRHGARGGLVANEAIADRRTGYRTIIEITTGIVEVTVGRCRVVIAVVAMPLRRLMGLRGILRVFPVQVEGLPAAFQAVVVLFGVGSHGRQPRQISPGEAESFRKTGIGRRSCKNSR